MSTRIGCDGLVYAIMKTEGTRTTPPTWDTPKDAPGVIAVNINANASLDTLFYDDGPGETASTLGMIEVEINKNELTTENKADFLGHMIDVNGGLINASNDIPPWMAIGFRTMKSSGKYRYVWLFQGKFAEPEDNNETKGDNVNWQTDTITGNFVKIPTKLMVKKDASDTTGTEKYPYKYEMDEEHSGADAATIKAWFDDVTLPPTV